MGLFDWYFKKEQAPKDAAPLHQAGPRITYFDLEVSPSSGKITDYGALDCVSNSPISEADFYSELHTGAAISSQSHRTCHTAVPSEFAAFLAGSNYLCGHNIIKHDLTFIQDILSNLPDVKSIDTLFLSPLLFPNKPYHHLLKDDKFTDSQFNNPLNDSMKAKILFDDELSAYMKLDSSMQAIYASLLSETEEFGGFFRYLNETTGGNQINIRPAYTITHSEDKLPTEVLSKNPKEQAGTVELLSELIKKTYDGRICAEADVSLMILNHPIALAYALALIDAPDHTSITPGWVLHQYPEISHIIRELRAVSCKSCSYCQTHLDIVKNLKRIFGYPGFRTYDGNPLQERAVQAAVDGKSLLAVFPTGGGKSITFQLPALMAGETEKGLTLVISPLQSLMKDQVDNLVKRGISDAVALNGLLDVIERANVLERIENGSASILYIAPESLRSRTIERVLMKRNIVRIVVDEAHCFSSWGQDFRVDYLYIGEFIRNLQKSKNMTTPIPVSCFTATAKQKVISDIRDYFFRELGLQLDLYATGAARKNLHYNVLYQNSDEDKYTTLRSLLESHTCPSIVYVSRTKRAEELADRLSRDGLSASAYHGQMDREEKQKHQEDFQNDLLQIIVATSAFGMGVDKSNVGLVVHYDISDSLENYVQEAGRAGRDPSLSAECYVLFNEGDLDKHFMLLNQTKLSMSEIQQMWKAIKELTRFRPRVCKSPLELARQAGWDESAIDMETRVKTAISALEQAGYIKRGHNVPHVYADSIRVHNMQEATKLIDVSTFMDDLQKQNAKRILSSLISKRSVNEATGQDAESRVDYLADRLGIRTADVIDLIQKLRQMGILADQTDLNAFLFQQDNQNKSLHVIRQALSLEAFMTEQLSVKSGVLEVNLKEWNEAAENKGLKSSINRIKDILYFWTIRGITEKSLTQYDEKHYPIRLKISPDELKQRLENRTRLTEFLVGYLFDHRTDEKSDSARPSVTFSLMELHAAYEQQVSLFGPNRADMEEIREALLYISQMNAIKLEGGFLVIYSSLDLSRLVLDNKIKYKKDDYAKLDEYYKMKIQQIHIVGEFANMMVQNYDDAMGFVEDYFALEYKAFIQKYFKGTRSGEINRNITPAKYQKLFGDLSDTQKEIITDDTSKYIVVAAGPGSGKTRILVHKLAALLQLEDVKHEQLLMVTFSRAAVSEFQKRLRELIGNAAYFVEIKTFHSYCFDLLGRIGSIEHSANVVAQATELIRSGEVEPSQIAKTVLVIDEAQDMDKDEFALITTLMERNEDMRIIAVGDDDQNIFEFRGSDSGHMKALIDTYGAKKYELTDNYRSDSAIVAFANRYVSHIPNRMKEQLIHPVSSSAGSVSICIYSHLDFESALVDDLLRCGDLTGQICVLTRTNEEAANIVMLLRKAGRRAGLLQSLDHFDLFNLIEIRYFLQSLNWPKHDTPIIGDDLWQTALACLEKRFGTSSNYQLCFNLLLTFRQTHDKLYWSDLETFLHESKLEDGYQSQEGEICVSTMHKAKGHEFDHVFLCIKQLIIGKCNPSDYKAKSAAAMRLLYVAFTRAKHSLHIHCISQILDCLQLKAGEYTMNFSSFPKPDQIITCMSHREVHLDYFIERSKDIFNCIAGQELKVEGDYLCADTKYGSKKVIRMSNSYQQLRNNWIQKGYLPVSAKIRYCVMWRKEDTGKETPILLADVIYKRS